MYQRIVVGTDGSETAMRAVMTAAEMARAHEARLCVTSAYAPKLTAGERTRWEMAPDDVRWRLSAGSIAEAVVQKAVVRAHVAAGNTIEIDGRFEPGPPVDVILDLVQELDADMVIVGNKGMAGLGHVRGSVARTLSRQAPCDVLIVDTVGAVRRDRSA